ncbi:MAG: hypothetical protein HW384_1748 [Dehalococcoidia bacterium]|nr:hypothetical protein [Dehalococcoidia bacterium]
MKINLKSNFDIGIFEMEFTQSRVTLRDVIQKLSQRQQGLGVIKESNPMEIDAGFDVRVNGRDYVFLPQRLDSLLKAGDQVEVSVSALGGG